MSSIFTDVDTAPRSPHGIGERSSLDGVSNKNRDSRHSIMTDDSTNNDDTSSSNNRGSMNRSSRTKDIEGYVDKPKILLELLGKHSTYVLLLITYVTFALCFSLDVTQTWSQFTNSQHFNKPLVACSKTVIVN